MRRKNENKYINAQREHVKSLTILTYGKSLSIPTVAAIAVLPLSQTNKIQKIISNKHIESKMRQYLPATWAFKKTSNNRTSLTNFNLFSQEHSSSIYVVVPLTTFHYAIKSERHDKFIISFFCYKNLLFNLMVVGYKPRKEEAPY